MKGMIAVSRVLAFPLCAQLLHSGLTLCDPTGIALCSSVRGTLRARIREWWPFPPPEDPSDPRRNPSHRHRSWILYLRATREALSSSIGILKCKILSKDASIFFFFFIICESKFGFMLIAFTGLNFGSNCFKLLLNFKAFITLLNVGHLFLSGSC